MASWRALADRKLHATKLGRLEPHEEAEGLAEDVLGTRVEPPQRAKIAAPQGVDLDEESDGVT